MCTKTKVTTNAELKISKNVYHMIQFLKLYIYKSCIINTKINYQSANNTGHTKLNGSKI